MHIFRQDAEWEKIKKLPCGKCSGPLNFAEGSWTEQNENGSVNVPCHCCGKDSPVYPPPLPDGMTY